MRLALVVGARPNFMKAAPLLWAASSRAELAVTLVHTGQHYDAALSDSFFRDLQMPAPDVHLEVGSGSHAVQTAAVMVRFEEFLDADPHDAVAVVGDVNSTMGATLVAAKRGVPVAHVEAGLRSFNRSMPEEINRIVTDALCDWLLTPSRDADENLLNEGIPSNRIFLVGNVMIDTLLAVRDRLDGRRVAASKGVDGRYGLVTLHRPSNVDDPDTFAGICDALRSVSRTLPLVFPVHPRTAARLSEFGLRARLGEDVVTCEPVSYLDSVDLMTHADVVLTDSGGVQEETTALGIPCLTLREETERPITVTEGTNRVVGPDKSRIIAAYEEVRSIGVEARCPPLWDGKAAERILDTLISVPPPLGHTRRANADR